MNAKKILLLLLTLSLVLAISSCGGGGTKPCEVCIDENGNGSCDVCNKKIPVDEISDVPLFEDGELTFQVVLARNTSSDVRQAVNSTLKSEFKSTYGMNIDVFTEGSENDKELDVEILIGNVTSRGDKYFFDGHSLGKNGYVIKIVDSKIIVNGGSEDSLIDVIKDFTDFLVSGADDPNFKITKDDTVLEIQGGYKVTSLKVNGNDMRGYTIAADLTRKYYKDVATTLQDIIYEDTGYWFDIVDIENATDKSVIMKHAPGKTGEDSFKVYADGTQLVIECAFDNSLETPTFLFATQHIATARGDVDFKGTVFNRDISVVYYDDFGAKGDGKTDDFFAIRDAHIFANECGQTVKASKNPEGKIYYIYDTRTDPKNNNTATFIPIQTNTDWQGVKFIIDDSKIPTFMPTENDPTLDEPGYDPFEHEKHYRLGRRHIFEILPNEEHDTVKINIDSVLDQIVADGLNPNTKKIDLPIHDWEGSLLIIPVNSEHGVFRRRGSYGSLQSLGSDMHEIILIDNDGNVSPETPIMFEYTHLDYISAYKVDENAKITVGNATIETIEPRVKNERYDKVTGANLFNTSYINRGICVKRSYTVVENITHVLSGGYTLKERASGLESSNYTGMFQAEYANHVTFRNCVMPGRQQYDGHSSYNFKAAYVNKIVLENCVQSNFWISVDPTEGIMKPSQEYVDGAVTSMSNVRVYDNNDKLQTVPLCWGIGGTNYCKNMEYINSQLSRFDAHAGLYNGKIINSTINAMELTGYGELVIENTDWYQYSAKQKFLDLRADYGYLWNGDLSVKDTRLHIYDTTAATPELTVVGHAYTNFYYGYPTVFPSVTLDNIDVYSTVKQAPVESGYAINLYNFVETSKQMHLTGDAGKEIILTYVDADGDDFIDEPLFDVNFDGYINDLDKIDLDQNGSIGNTSLKYSDYANLDVYTLNKGITYDDCKKNVNTIKPPEYIKIINNDGVNGSGGYVYTVYNTAGKGVSDGGWYRDASAPDTMGGFFGNTKFIYGLGENDYFHGSDYVDQNLTTTFKFFN